MPLRRFKRLLTALSGVAVAAGLAVPGVCGEVFSLTTVASFSGPNGSSPQSGLLRGQDGYFYGTTFMGGASGSGGIYKLPTGGSLTNFASLTPANGTKPYASLIQTPDGLLYGTASQGGAGNFGTVFRLTTNGALTTLMSFAGTNGSRPTAKLLRLADGSFYGTTFQGGSNDLGTVFRMSSSGVLTTVATFNGANGANPFADVIQGMDGSLYGTTINGGDDDLGTVFKMTTNGVLTTLWSFSGTNGSNPYGGLHQEDNGVLYGTTTYGGVSFDGSIQSGYGTVYRITTNGAFQNVFFFSGNYDGWNPWTRLVKGGDGNLYGTTILGGNNGYGTAFQITTNGVHTPLLSFAFDDNGITPYGELLPGSYNSLYGTTFSAGPGGDGTVFVLNPAPTRLQTSVVFNTLNLIWPTVPGQVYQVQYRTYANSSTWFNFGNSLAASGHTLQASDAISKGTNRCYRVVLVLPP